MNKRKFLAAFAAVVLSASVATALPAKTVSAEWEKTSSGYSYKDDETGKKLKGWQKIDGKKYYFDKKGNAVTGFKKIDGKTYYFIPNKKGQMATKWQKIGFDRYYFAKDGSMYSNCWMTLSGKKYYCTSDGKIAVGHTYISGKTYTFDKNGILLENTAPFLKFGTSYDSGYQALRKRYEFVVSEDTDIGTFLYCGTDADKGSDLYLFDDKNGLVVYGALSTDKNTKKMYEEIVRQEGFKYDPDLSEDDRFTAYSSGDQLASILITDDKCYLYVFSEYAVDELKKGNYNNVFE